MPRLPGLRPSRYASGLRGFSTGHPALAKNWPASLRATLRAFLHPPAAVIRGPQELKQRPKPKTEQRPKPRSKPKPKPKPKRQLTCNAKRALVLSPQRFGRVAQRWPYPLCSGERCPVTTRLDRSGLSPRYAAGLSLFRPFSLGYFSFGPAKEK